MKIGLKLIHRYIYFFGLALLVAGLPISKVPLSFAVLILFLNWLIEGHLGKKLSGFFKNTTALVISSLFLLHLIGLIYTTDFGYAFLDLQVKIPMLLLPLIISTSEALSKKQIQNLLLFFVFAVLVSTFLSLYIYLTKNFVDIRAITPYISHIRLSLMICLSIFMLLYFVFSDHDFSKMIKLIFILTMIWLSVFLVILESITGLSVLIITALILALIALIKMKSRLYKLIIAGLIIIVSSFVVFYLLNIYKDYRSFATVHKNEIRQITSKGNAYNQDTLNKETENGYYIYWNISEDELREAWNKRSHFKFDSIDRKGQDIKFTLIRFLTSKGYNKDAEGVSKLTNEEVHSIENGVASVNYIDMKSLRTRILETIWELENYNINANPNRHTIMQRFEYWKASLGIIRSHLLIGVGTGDMNIAFARQYDKMKSPLEKRWRLRSHNQFLSFSVGFGLFGLLWFLFVLVYPFLHQKGAKGLCLYCFLYHYCIIYANRDTLESQTGLTFFVFFNTIFLLGKNES